MCLQKSILKLMRNHFKWEFQIQIEVTFLLIMIEIPGLWHFKANAVLFSNMIKCVSKGPARGPLTRGAPLLGVGRVALKPALLADPANPAIYKENTLLVIILGDRVYFFFKF